LDIIIIKHTHAQQSGNKCTWRDLNSPPSPQKFLVANEAWPEGRLEVGSYLSALYACNHWSLFAERWSRTSSPSLFHCVLSHFEVISAPLPLVHMRCVPGWWCAAPCMLPKSAQRQRLSLFFFSFFFFWGFLKWFSLSILLFSFSFSISFTSLYFIANGVS
jgi:hypothetical protein